MDAGMIVTLACFVGPVLLAIAVVVFVYIRSRWYK